MDDGRAARGDSPAMSTHSNRRQIGAGRRRHPRRRTRKAARLVAKNFFCDGGASSRARRMKHGVLSWIGPRRKRRIMKTRLLFQHGLGSLALMSSAAWAASNVSFSQSVETVEAYDYVEVTLNVDKPDARNPFLDVAVTGSFSKTDGSERKTVEGFCDSVDGTVFRIRFMPASPGDYTWSATHRQGAAETTHTGAFKASAGQHKGPIRVDPKYPWHFIWEGTD